MDTKKTQAIKDFNNRSRDRKALTVPETIPGLKETKDEKENVSVKEQITEKAIDTREQLAIENAMLRNEQLRLKVEKEKQAGVIDKVSLATDEAKEKIAQVAAPGVRFLSSLPTPGGIGVILFIIVIFLMAVIPVNAQGDTRLKLIWLTLLGRTHLAYSNVTQSSSGNTNNSVITPTFNKNINPQGTAPRHTTMPQVPNPSSRLVAGGGGGLPEPTVPTNFDFGTFLGLNGLS
jgi:hypothetical protein